MKLATHLDPEPAEPKPASSAGTDHETPLTDRNVLPALLRYRDRHRWGWNLSMRLINLYYGTNYTEKQLRSLYKAHTHKN